jgi:hypothetical protein
MAAYRPAETHVHDHQEDHDDTHHHGNPLVVNELPALEGFELIDALDALVHRQADEAIHTLVPHVDNAVLQREHLSLFELVRYDQVTHIAIHSGAWSNPATWTGGKVPTHGSRVLIPIGIDVQVDGVIAARVATLRVDGTLAFDPTRNTELRAETVIVSGNGTFQMGTPDEPIAAGVRARLVFIDSGAIDRQSDPFGISRGLIGHGTVSVHGNEVTSYAALSGPALAGT